MNYSELSDEELVEKYTNGDQYAFVEVMERYKRLVRSMANTYFIAGADSDDVIQEGMIGLFKAVADYKPDRDASFKTFAAICINRNMITAVNSANTKKNSPLNNYVSFYTPAFQDEDNDMKMVDVLLPESELSPEDILLDTETANGFEKSIRESLSKMENQVLDMYMEGLNYTQIAVVMGKEPKSIDNALQRIRAKANKLIRKN